MSFPAQRQDGQPGLEHLMVPRPVSVSPTYRPAAKLKGKVALVTGGDSGIGRAVCYHFALEGATVAFVYVSPQEDADADETLRKLANEYKTPDARNPIKIPVTDLGYDQNCKKVVDDVMEAYGSIDILVNCAAEGYVTQKIEDLEPKQLEDTFRTNVFSQFFMARHVVKHMREGNCIINTLSRQAYLGNPIMLDYSSSKGAILTFTKGLASQLVKHKIRVNGVAPGPIWTPMNVTLYDENEVAHLGENTPMGRAGQPSEVAPSYVFLASEDSSYITGQVIHPNARPYILVEIEGLRGLPLAGDKVVVVASKKKENTKAKSSNIQAAWRQHKEARRPPPLYFIPIGSLGGGFNEPNHSPNQPQYKRGGEVKVEGSISHGSGYGIGIDIVVAYLVHTLSAWCSARS